MTGKGRGRGRPSKKHNTRGAATVQAEDENSCSVCNRQLQDGDHITCERCNKDICYVCFKVTPEQLEAAAILPNNHFFCDECDQQAIIAVQTDQEIEVRCKQYCSQLETRIERVETGMTLKADKAEFDELKSKVARLETMIKNFSKDVSVTNQRINLVRGEDHAKKMREKNIVIRGVNEGVVNEGEEVTDEDLVHKVLRAIDCADLIPDIEKFERLGKRNPTRNQNLPEEAVANDEADDAAEDAAEPERPYYRPIRVEFKSVDSRTKALKQAIKIRNGANAEITEFDHKLIFIVPDQTKLERERDLKLRKELKKKRQENPNGRYMISRGRVVLRQEDPQM